MSSRISVGRGLSLIALTIVVAHGPSGCLGCAVESETEPSAGSAAPASPEGELLRRRFPARAAAILDAGEPFAARDDAFTHVAKTSSPASWGWLDVELPRDGSRALRLTAAAGFEIHVREVGATGEGRAAARAVQYRRAGGTSFWTASGATLEEWLHLDAGAVRRGEAAASWQIDGASLRQDRDAVQLVDAQGRALVHVSAPEAFAASGRSIPVRLEARGDAIDLYVDVTGVEGEAILVDPSWTVVSPLNVGRNDHTATLLQNGKVLVTGGNVSSIATTAFCELYDPATNIWSFAASLASPRVAHAASLLLDGRVIVVGGNGTNFAPEIYDPVANTWTAAAALPTNLFNHTATTLQSGKVLVVGGQVGGSYAGARVYDPATNTWVSTGAGGGGRMLHSAVLLQSGKVIVAGGFNSGAQAAAQLYDPATNTWSSGGTLNAARNRGDAVLLPNGKVLYSGGGDDSVNYLAFAELYDPATNTWSLTGSMLTARRDLTTTLLPIGKVLAAGGGGNTLAGQATAELYDPATGTWAATVSMSTGHNRHTATLLPNGKVLVAGGITNVVSGTNYGTIAEIFAISNGIACTQPADCATGFCVDGYCCDTACGGGTDSDCQACDVLGAEGTCTLLSSTTICRPAANGCDKPELCSGSGAQCPADAAQPNGTACDDGNLCTQSDTCQNGVCVGGTPVTCTATDQCHAAGTCSPLTGCSNPPKPDGTACSDGSACTQTDTCQAGACTGGNPVVCPAPDQCHTAGTCNPATGVCSNPVKPDGTACNDGSACTQTDTCQAGACTGGNPVVCQPLDGCHTAGVCDPANGLCSNPAKPNGAACDDGNLCTQMDACQSGNCVGGNPVVCPAPDQCHTAGTCNPTTGVCSNPPKPDGTACSDGDACTQTDTCQSGVCSGNNPIVCQPLDGCHMAGVCNPVNGLCSNPAKADGAACDDGNLCTQMDACQSGNCVGGNPVVCPTPDQCHTAGTCNPATGVCSNPAKADDSACDDGDACTQMDACHSGVCTGTPVVCSAPDQCHTAGTCDPATGMCSSPVEPDGTACTDGTCVGGVCVSSSSSSTSSSSGGGAGGSGGATTGSTTGSGGATTGSTTGSGGAATGATTGGGGGARGSTTSSSGGSPGEQGKCGCVVVGAPASSRAAWLAAVAVLIARRRKQKRAA